MSNRDLNIMDTLDMWPLHLELPLVAATISSASYLQITVVFAFFYWLLNARVRAMVNIMTARIHEAYEGGSVKQASSLHHSLSQIQLKKREKLTKNKDLLANAINNSLFETKTEKWGDKVLHLPQRRPITGMSCSHCTPTSRKSAPGNSIPGVNILNLEAFSQRPKGILAGTFATLSHCITFPNHTFPYIYDSVLQDETVQDAVRQTADEIASELGITDNHDLQILLANNKKRAVKILTRMHSKMSNFVIKAIAWILHKTLPRLFRSMTIPAHQLDMLREASKKGIPIIYLPLHRSHIDYVALTFTLCNNGLRSPLVAAGANLNIPFFGRILQGLGAFFIKRRIDPVAGKKDKIYRALLHTYMTHCIEAGHHFEFFIEGGRTRTGKPCMPKGGLLSVFVDAYLTGVLEDALLVPVSVNYERIVEGSFVRELTGEPKKPETFLRAIKGIWKALTDKYGMVRVDFNQPFSLHELVGSFQGKLHGNENRPLHVVPSSASLYGTDVIAEDQRNLVDSIARHIIFDCARSTAVMSTNALAFLLLHVHRKGATLGELTFSLDVLRDELLTSGKDLGFSGESKDALEHAIDLLGPGLVQKEKTTDGDVFVKPVTISPNVIELAYYSNSLLPHFSLESVLALAIVSLTKGVSEPRLEQEKLIETSVRLCEILQYEFIFSKTCQSLENSLRDVIDDFCLTQILVKIDMPYARTRRSDYLGIGESDDDDVYVPPQRYTVNASHPKCQLYSRLIRPIVDAYAVTASYIKSLGDRGVEETVLVREVLGKTTTLIREGIIPNGETLSMEHVKNCLKLLDKWQAVNVTVAGSKKIYVVDDLKADEALDRISLFDA